MVDQLLIQVERLARDQDDRARLECGGEFDGVGWVGIATSSPPSSSALGATKVGVPRGLPGPVEVGDDGRTAVPVVTVRTEKNMPPSATSTRAAPTAPLMMSAIGRLFCCAGRA